LYNGVAAVSGINFRIKRGELYGFLGPNGAGKTTTMRMIQCVSPITSGSLTVNGMFVGRDDRDIKAIIGVAPQDDSLDQDLSVIDNLVVYAGYFDIPRNKAISIGEGLLKFFHMEERKKARIDSLSGGMRRRLVIARALINSPTILILDEPASGLDPQARHLIWEKLRDLKSQGASMILTTHYMEEASQLCDRISIMDQGSIVLTGNPTGLVKENVGNEVIEFSISDNADKILGSINERYEIDGDLCIIYAKNPSSVLGKLAKYEISSLSRRPATLEDLFLKTTGRQLKSGP
tara:strand:- start:206883 stop:207758 length:876 start_codon:yes stop_codon:yes gene_type:complete